MTRYVRRSSRNDGRQISSSTTAASTSLSVTVPVAPARVNNCLATAAPTCTLTTPSSTSAGGGMAANPLAASVNGPGRGDRRSGIPSTCATTTRPSSPSPLTEVSPGLCEAFHLPAGRERGTAVPRRRHAALMLAALSALAACSAGASTRPAIAVHGDGEELSTAAVPSGPREVPPLADSEADRRAWSKCTASTKARMGDTAPVGGGEYECARLTVRLDAPSRPGRGSLGLALLRIGTGRSPLVVVGDAGGEPGTVKAARMAASL